MKKLMKVLALAAFATLTTTAVQAAEARSVLGAECNNPPRISCGNANCLPELVGNQGPAVEKKSGRHFYLEFPCDLKKGEKVNFVLSLHGAGSIGNWQRHYFPFTDFKDKYRLVVITPTALTDKPTRTWQAAADDQYLHDVVDEVTAAFGKQNIRSFWLAGHSQGGMTSKRIVCSDYFKGKIDGHLNLSGGRIGAPPAPPRPANGAAAPAAAAPDLSCDFNFIYGTGQLEATGQALPATSPVAERYHCAPRVKLPDVVDEKAGYVTATDQSRGPSWGRFARPGTANLYVFPKCDGGRLVMDINRLDKGHTEGYEPHVTEEIIKAMMSAPVLKGPNAKVKKT
jgi:hypothetical protein